MFYHYTRPRRYGAQEHRMALIFFLPTLARPYDVRNSR